MGEVAGCSQCGEGGREREAWYEDIGGGGATVKCRKCDSWGHYARDCPYMPKGKGKGDQGGKSSSKGKLSPRKGGGKGWQRDAPSEQAGEDDLEDILREVWRNAPPKSMPRAPEANSVSKMFQDGTQSEPLSGSTAGRHDGMQVLRRNGTLQKLSLRQL